MRTLGTPAGARSPRAWMQGAAGALWMIIMRVGQGVGGAMLFANSSAILTDAFPENQPGRARRCALIVGGTIALVAFCVIETRVEHPMFRLDLFRIRAFTAANLASLPSAIGRGGLQFILITWLQGIWLPQHGYSFAETPLWAGIYMVPPIAGFLIAGPISGWLSDRYGARRFATGGMIAAASFLLLQLLPVDFPYIWFALILLLNGLGMGLFASPNRAGIMNSLPPHQRGVGAG